MGTKLTDAKFFGELLDTTRPGLETIPALAAKEDYAACRRVFAAHVREMLDPQRFFACFPNGERAQKSNLRGASAEETLRNIVVSCEIEHDYGDGPIDWFLNPTYNGYKEWTWQLNRHPAWCALAEVYRRTGDEKYAACCAAQLRGWIDQAQIPEDNTPPGATLCWRTIECGIRMGQNWPEVIHTFYKSPAFTDDIITDWCKSVWEHGDRLRRIHAGGNWLIMEMNGLAQLSVLYPCLKEADEWYAFAMQTLLEQIPLQVYPDGFQHELTTHYHLTVVMNYMIIIRLVQAYGRPLDQRMLDAMEKMLCIYVQLMRPDGCCPDLNDGENLHIPIIAKHALETYPENDVLRWAATGGKEGKEPNYTSTVFPYAGLGVLRSGWGKDDVWLMLDGGPFGTGHQHEDKLQVLFSVGEDPVLNDTGSYAYDDSEMRKYVLSTRGHNTVRVDGMDQNRRKTYKWHAEDIEKISGLQYKLGGDVEALRAVYDEGYGEDQDKSITHERSVYFVKSAAGCKPFALVVDRLTADAVHDYEVLWRLNKDKLALDGMQVTAGELSILVPDAPMETAGLGVSRGVQFPQWQGWAVNSSKQKDFCPIYTAQYWLHGQNMRWVTLLYPAADCPFTGVETGLDVTDTAIVLRKADGTAFALDEADLW